MAEINATIASPVLYDTNKYFLRSEWGGNGNPHFHQLQTSDKLSKWFYSLKVKFEDGISALEDKFNSEHQENAPSKDELSVFENQISELFKQVQTEYMNRMKNYHTNWNSGYTKNGKQKTFDFRFDAKTTATRSDVESMIDQFYVQGKDRLEPFSGP